MVITYFGGSFFKIQFGDLTIASNPISKDSKLKSSRFGADIVLVSINHSDFNGVEQVTYGEKTPFVVSSPGEYEVKDVAIKGLFGGVNDEGLRNTIYRLSLEGMNICVLGALSSKELKSEAKASLEDIDILFVPIGGGILGAGEAYKLAVSLEPKIIIPAHFDSDQNSLKTFLKEGGQEKREMIEKLTLKKKELEGKEGEIVVLSPQV